MLSERPYMRDDYPREKTSAFTWLLAAIAGAFVLELVLVSPWFGVSGQLVRGLAVTIRGLADGRIWTFSTYWLLHSPRNLLHVACVLAGLYTLGRELEPALGRRRFVALFASATVMGGLLWSAVNWNTGGVLMGASAGVCGCLALYAALHPNREFGFLLFFFFPVTFKPKHVALGLMAVDLFAFGFYEIIGNAPPFAYAPSAHLGGMMAGWIFFRYLSRPARPFTAPRHGTESPAWLNRAARPGADSAPQPRSEPGSRAHLRAEVDRILDKINSHGFGSLSAAEKRVLDEAKDLSGRR